MTKLEQVARAIASKINHDPDFDDCMEAARAAVEALREPTDAMHINRGLLGPRTIREQWMFMVDAILSEKPDAG